LEAVLTKIGSSKGRIGGGVGGWGWLEDGYCGCPMVATAEHAQQHIHG